jgi:formylmethanofuran dehydrogenase subunit E
MLFKKKPKKHKCGHCNEKFVREDMELMWLTGLVCKRCFYQWNKNILL